MSEHRLEVADVFRQHAREFFARWGFTLSAHQRKAFRDICACRTAALGARFEQCNHCSHQNIQFLSCRNRHCPKCQSTARDRWLDRTAKSCRTSAAMAGCTLCANMTETSYVIAISEQG